MLPAPDYPCRVAAWRLALHEQRCNRSRRPVESATYASTPASSPRPTPLLRANGERRSSWWARRPDRLNENRAGCSPPAAVANCAHWLDAEVELLKPRVLILVGQMAIARFLGPGTLESRVGLTFGKRPVMVPLPHPSGQSRWLNDHSNRERLEKALAPTAQREGVKGG